MLMRSSAGGGGAPRKDVSTRRAADDDPGDDDPGQELVYSLRNVRKIFRDGEGGKAGGIEIDRLDIPAGKMVAILGDSGSGKTTLLSLLGHLLEPDMPEAANLPGGEHGDGRESVETPAAAMRPKLVLCVVRAGENRTQNLVASSLWQRFGRVFRPELVHREIGFVFQEAHLLRNATVSLNLAVSLATAGKRERRPREIISEMARLLEADRQATGRQGQGLAGKLGARARILSGGQAQRVALGRAVIRNPAVVLADEPTASLDAIRGNQIMAMLHNWQRQGTEETPRTVIWVTHDVAQAATFADDVIILRGGRLLDWMDGRPIANPRDVPLLFRWLATGKRGEPPDRRRQNEVESWQDTWKRRVEGATLSLEKPRRTAGGGASPEASETVHERAGESADEAEQNRHDPSPAVRRFSPPSILWRLAFSEAFSRDVPGRNNRFMRGAMTIADAEALRSTERERTSFGRLIVLALSLAAFLAFAFAHWDDRIAFGEVAKWSLLSASIAGGTVVLFWNLARAFSKKSDLATFFLLLLAFGAAAKGYDAVQRFFAARLASPDLSHVVIEVENPKNLTDATIPQLSALFASLRRPGNATSTVFSPPAPTTSPAKSRHAWAARGRQMGRPRKRGARGKTASAAAARFVYGRVTAGVAIGQAHLKTKDGKPADAAKKMCPQKERPTTSGIIELLAVDLAEPFIAHLRHLEGPTLAQLKPTAFEPPKSTTRDGFKRLVYVTRKFLRKHLRLGSDTPLAEHKVFCLRLYGTYAPVEIAGIVERLPDDGRDSDFQILATVQHARRAMKDSHFDRSRVKQYRVAALYLDPGRIRAFMAHVEKLANEGIRVRVRRAWRTVRFELGDAFAKIRKLLSLSEGFRYGMLGAVGIIFLLSGVMVAIMARNFILQNERSLCVMRAFGIRTPSIFLMMLMQFAVVLLPGIGAILLLAHVVWPAAAASIAPALEMPLQALVFTWHESSAILGAFLTILLTGCLASMAYWWWNSRWIAERLKEIG